MEIKQLVSSDSVICNADVNSKKRALELMGELLSKNSDPSNSLQIFQQLTERENLGSTSLGHGVALPHARTSLCKEATGVFLKLDHGIDFDSPDQQPTDLLFALMVPEDYTDEHLEILATLAGLLNQEDFCNTLRSASSSTELHHTLTNWQADLSIS